MQKFSQRDAERAMKAAMKAGVPIGRVEFRPDGTLAIFTNSETEVNPDHALDDEIMKRRRARGKH